MFDLTSHQWATIASGFFWTFYLIYSFYQMNTLRSELDDLKDLADETKTLAYDTKWKVCYLEDGDRNELAAKRAEACKTLGIDPQHLLGIANCVKGDR